MTTRIERQRAVKLYPLAILLGVASFLPINAVGESHNGDDIKSFGLLNVSGHFRTGYLFDDRERGTGSSSSFEQRATWEEVFFLLTESFIYHPGFLNMDFGGGPILVQQQFDSNLGETSHNDSLFNVLARLNFLELKTYPFSLYYQRSHPSVTTSLAGRFLTENDTYVPSPS